MRDRRPPWLVTPFLVCVVGCATIPDPVTVFCDEFEVGSDFAHDREVDPASPERTAIAQAVSDVAVLARTFLQSVDAACVDLAASFPALGPAGGDVELSASERVEHDCARAAAGIRESRSALRAANVAVWFAEQPCLVDTAYQLQCEARCQADASCSEADAPDRCRPGDELTLCDGRCAGTCEGLQAAPVTCEGSCSGECVGVCLRADAPRAAFVSGARCDAVCVGHCGASCTPLRPATCDGSCRGKCEGTALARHCASPLAAPHCLGATDCHAACRASASARATCAPVALGVTMSGATVGRTRRQALALERNLAAILLVSRRRGDDIREAARTLEKSARESAADESSREETVCAVTMARTGIVADENARAASRAAKAVTAAVDFATTP